MSCRSWYKNIQVSFGCVKCLVLCFSKTKSRPLLPGSFLLRMHRCRFGQLLESETFCWTNFWDSNHTAGTPSWPPQWTLQLVVSELLELAGGFRTWTWKSIQSTSTNMSFGSLGTSWSRLNCDKMCSLHIFANVLRSQTCQSSPKCFHHHWTNGNFLINVCAFALLGNP